MFKVMDQAVLERLVEQDREVGAPHDPGEHEPGDHGMPNHAQDPAVEDREEEPLTIRR